VILTREELAAIQSQAEAEYPRECCGVVLVRNDPGPARRLFRCRNIQDELHARDREAHPRDARTAYFIAPEDLLAIGRAEQDGYRVHVIYHSHIDCGAYFSETDRRNALLGDHPAYPEATYVVAAVNQGRMEEVRAFRWDAPAATVVPVPLEVA